VCVTSRGGFRRSQDINGKSAMVILVRSWTRWCCTILDLCGFHELEYRGVMEAMEAMESQKMEALLRRGICRRGRREEEDGVAASC